MAERREVYKCEACGNIVEVLHGGPGVLVCCGSDMKAMFENTSDGAKEKHVPVIAKTDKGVTVKVGSVPHPMLAEHFIEWIELVADGKVFREYLQPGQAPEATFCLCFTPKTLEAREYCNLHGLWKA